jgi:hypothetical protein
MSEDEWKRVEMREESKGEWGRVEESGGEKSRVKESEGE